MKLSIKTRLYIGFTGAIILVIAVGIIAYLTFREQHTDAVMIKQTYEVLNKLQTLQKTLIDMETGRRGFRSTNNAIFLEPYNKGVAIIHPLLRDLKTSVNDNEIQATNFKALEESTDRILAFWNSINSNTRSYRSEELEETMLLEKQKMDEIRQAVDVMTSAEKKVLATRINNSDTSVRLAIIGLITGISLILFIVVALIFLILYSFRHRKKVEQELKKSNHTLIELNKESVKKNWVLAGVAKVNDSLHNASGQQELSQNLLNEVVRYLNVNAGAVYLYNAEEKKLSASASYAVPNNFKRTFNLHEGLVGAAAVKKTPTIITGLTKDQLTIETATVNAAPAMVCYIPFYIDDNLKAVIELLSFEELDKQHFDLLHVTGDNIALAIDAVQNNERVTELLRQVQEQKEILEHQQEELRQTNEELSLQAEVLQASEEELRVQEEELRQINGELQEKNAAVESARAAVATKAKELEATNQYKSDFLANMSHELRTPLNSVLILAKLLADNAGNNLTEKQANQAKIIYKSGSDLLELINDILDLSKIEAGKVEVDINDVAVESISRNVQQLFAVVAEEKGIDFVIEVDKEVQETIKTDQQKVEQILKNLLSNAFKFTKKAGTVSLKIGKVSSSEISFSVSDTGIGIPGEKQQLIFDAFQQADMSTSRRFGGTGLGLSITKELVRLLNGRVEVTSKEDIGSTFKVIIPTTPTHVNAQPIPVAEQIKVEDILAVKPEEQTIIDDDRHKLEKRDKVMLIVEDDPFFATIVKDLAEERGYKTIVAINGSEALYCAKKFKPSVITLDIHIPGIDGRNLLKILKNDEELKHIPVHIISASDDEGLKETGALAYLQKPVQKSDLEQAFTTIGKYLHSTIKRVMVYSVEKEDGIEPSIDLELPNIAFEKVTDLEEAILKLGSLDFDCLIADIGTHIEEGIAELKRLNEALQPNNIPAIIYLDRDISGNNEMEIKKISSVVVRKSATSQTRVIEELELFLYKVQQDNSDAKKSYSPTVNRNGSLENKTVLIVDDDMRNVFALSAVLEQKKMVIITASDGKEALDALKKNPTIDIVLMDLMMPEMDGYEAMEYIRKNMKLTKLPVIALTAKAMAGDREKCLEAGASDYITKPVDTQKLVSLMHVWLS